ncbi:MAG TPA: DsbA family protein [Longimicrobiales bacterium]|nr:DsbA family protein [Longimicrobiales bacterium]
MLQARLYLDYVDPGSFLMDRRLTALEETLALSVERLAWEVRRPPEPLLDPEDPAWTGYWREMAHEARGEGVELVEPGLVPWTRKAHELALHAREKGCFDKVHRALMDAFHLEGLDLGRVDVLVTLGSGVGLDLSETKAVLDVDRHAETLAMVRNEGVQRGVRGVPTLVCGGALLEGVHSTDDIAGFLRSSMTQGES